MFIPLLGTMSCRDRYPIPHACGKTCKAASFIVPSNGMDKTCSEAGTQIRSASSQKMGLIGDAKIRGRCAVEGCKGGRALVRAREGIECQDHEAQRAAHWPCCYRTAAMCIDLHRYRCHCPVIISLGKTARPQGGIVGSTPDSPTDSSLGVY